MAAFLFVMQLVPVLLKLVPTVQEILHESGSGPLRKDLIMQVIDLLQKVTGLNIPQSYTGAISAAIDLIVGVLSAAGKLTSSSPAPAPDGATTTTTVATTVTKGA